MKPNKKIVADSSSLNDQYDSDEDLTKEQQQKIKKLSKYYGEGEAEKARKAAWEKADMYPKIKKFFKGAVYGDKRKD